MEDTLTSLAMYCIYGFVWIPFVLIMIGLTIFWIIMLIDAIRRDFKNDNEKLVWIILLVVIGQIAAIIYYFAVKRNPKYNS